MPVKCKNCGIRLQNTRGGDRLIINDDSVGIRCIHCWSIHSWITGQLIKKEVKINSKIN